MCRGWIGRKWSEDGTFEVIALICRFTREEREFAGSWEREQDECKRGDMGDESQDYHARERA